MKKVIIIGAGSVGGHIANNLDLYGISGRLAGFLDDDISKQGKTCLGILYWGQFPGFWINMILMWSSVLHFRKLSNALSACCL